MKIITTIGTSLFTNSKESNDDYKSKFCQNTWANIESSKEDDTSIINILYTFAQNSTENACAEIASLVKIQKELNIPIEAYLICSYTLDCRIAAEAIKMFFDSKPDLNISIPENAIKVIDSLLVTDKETFELGLSNLFTEIETIAKNGEKYYWDNIIFNITGGYKGLIPHLTILGQIQKCPIYYIFNNEGEDNNYQLLKVPFVPIHFNWIELYPVLDFLNQTALDNPNFQEVLGYIQKGYLINQQNSFALTKTKIGYEAEKAKEVELSNKILLYSAYYAIYIKMLLNGLIDKNLNLTNLGKLIKKIEEYNTVGKSYLGDTMEVFLQFYFNEAENIKQIAVNFYTSAINYNINYNTTKNEKRVLRYKIIDFKDKKISLDNTNKDDIEIGDIDVSLNNNKTQNFVLCETKALSNISTYADEIGKKSDYYFQIKSRILQYFRDNKNKNQVEFLFLIYDFQIQGLQSSIFEKIKKYDTTTKVLKHLKTLEQDEDLKNKIIVNFITLQKIQELDKYGANKSLYDVTSVNNIFEVIDINQL